MSRQLTVTPFNVDGIDVELAYKAIKNLNITVYPTGRIRVSAPMRLNDDQVRLAILQRLPWIMRQRQRLTSTVGRSEPELTTGEFHGVWGRRCRLEIIEHPGRPRVETASDRLVMFVRPGTPPDRLRIQLDSWYRQQLRQRLPVVVAKWEPRMGVSVPKWTIRRMKTRWGSCNCRTRHLTFNLELAKKDPDCLEYVVVHELNHYFVRDHGPRFIALMDQHLPDWRSRRARLNRVPGSSDEVAVADD